MKVDLIHAASMFQSLIGINRIIAIHNHRINEWKGYSFNP